jgi:hypothetical protein
MYLKEARPRQDRTTQTKKKIVCVGEGGTEKIHVRRNIEDNTKQKDNFMKELKQSETENSH